MIGILDYGAGNLRSVANALEYLGLSYCISFDKNELDQCDRLIFPGVGAASASMVEVKKRGIDLTLKDALIESKPILGICVGCQIILDFSEEDGGVDCLGFIPGKAKRFSMKKGMKIPHMGWNQLEIQIQHPIFHGIQSGTEFYFVHSYFPETCAQEHVLGRTTYGDQVFASVIAFGSLVATQFHAEKSGGPGLNILKNFSLWNGK
jgi:imidazole glycerol-phosphate synthase subunit HisH